MTARKAEVERARAQAGISQVQVEDMALYAPVDGVVLTKSAEPGEVLAAGATVVTIGDIDHPWLRGYVNETDLGKVKLGSEGEGHHRFVPRQGLQRAHHVHLVGGGVHAQADPDQRGAGEAGLPRSRSRSRIRITS